MPSESSVPTVAASPATFRSTASSARSMRSSRASRRPWRTCRRRINASSFATPRPGSTVFPPETAARHGMSAPIETHRSMVKAWECDSFGHFTVAYYFDRIADASATEREALAVPEDWVPAEYVASFTSELRAGEAFHIESGVITVEDAAVRLGHKLINSASGKLCTTIVERLAATPGSAALSTREREALRTQAVPWDDSKEDGIFGDHTADGFVTS